MINDENIKKIFNNLYTVSKKNNIDFKEVVNVYEYQTKKVSKRAHSKIDCPNLDKIERDSCEIIKKYYKMKR